jgi:uncharacterized protein (TIGR03083 family)
MTGWTHDAYCDALGPAIERMADAVRGADLSAPVPTCPGWSLADLIEHTGIIHRWAAEMVRQLSPERLDRERMDVPVPAPEERADWLASGADDVVAAFRAADPDASMWAWGAEQLARFWPRRMLHETTVHRADAELALGRHPAIAPEVAVDGIDELLENLPYAARFRPRVKELRGTGETIHLHATDADDAGEWTIRLEPDGFSVKGDHAKGTVAVRGSAGDLLLLLYGRRRLDDDRLSRFGDEPLLGWWLEHSAL